MYKELLFQCNALDGKLADMGDARTVLSKACQGVNVNPLVFQHDPVSGKTVHNVHFQAEDGQEIYYAPPLVSIDGRGNYIKLLGLGQSGIELLESQSVLLFTALVKYLGAIVKFTEYSGRTDLEMSRPSLYQVHRMLIGKKSHVYNQDIYKEQGRFTLASVEPLIKKAILQGIIGQAKFIDSEFGTGLESSLGTDEMLNIRIIHGDPFILRSEKRDLLGVKRLVFSINLELKGRWSAGYVRSMGFGLFRPVRG